MFSKHVNPHPMVLSLSSSSSYSIIREAPDEEGFECEDEDGNEDEDEDEH